MLGFSSLGFNTPSVIECYDYVQEKKNDTIATVIANHSDRKERASSTALGAMFGVVQSALFTGAYFLAKAFPKLQSFFPVKWAVGKVDDWVNIAKTNNPQKSLKYNIGVGIASKSLWLIGVGALLGFGADLYKTYTNTRITGKVSDTKKGAVSDSWLLSGLNSLAATKEGKEVIKNSIQKNKDNTVTVKFKGIDREYNITKKELKDASRAYITRIGQNGKVKGFDRKYSKGDGDVLAFEIAYEKYQQELRDGKIEQNPNLSTVSSIEENNIDLFKSGNIDEIYYLLSGKKSVHIDTSLSDKDKDSAIMNMYSKACLNKFFKEYSKGENKYAVGIKLNGNENNKLNVRNKYLAKIKLDTSNTYSIKKMNDKYATIVNPSKSKIEYEIPVETLKRYAASISYIPLEKSSDV